MHTFRSMWIGPPIPEVWLFGNLTIKIQAHGWVRCSRSHGGSNNLSTHILFVPCESAIPFLGFGYFKICHWKSTIKIAGEVIGRGPTIRLASIRWIFFFVYRQSVQPFIWYDIIWKNIRQKSFWKNSSKITPSEKHEMGGYGYQVLWWLDKWFWTFSRDTFRFSMNLWQCDLHPK